MIPPIPRLADRLLRMCLQFAATALMVALLPGVLHMSGHLMYVWPVTGIQLALLLRSREQGWEDSFEIAAAATGFLVLSLLQHSSLHAALLHTAVQAAELWLLLYFLGDKVRCFDDLKTRDRVSRLLIAATLIPVGAALFTLSTGWQQLSFLRVWSSIALADSLGIVVFTPALLFLFSGRLWRKDQTFHEFKAGTAASIVFLGVTIAIFSQSANPFLFMMFPPLLLVVFVLGVRGAIFASLAGTLIACWATAHGHGPIWIVPGMPLQHRISVLRILLWSIVTTALPVGSLLDERNVSEQQARKNQAIYETLIQNSEDIIILSSLDGASRFISPAVEKLTGWTSPEFLALRKLGSIHEEDRDLARQIIASLTEGKTNHTFRYRILRKEGGFTWVEAFVRGYREVEGGPVTGYVATVHDITALKQTEETWSAEKYALATQNERLAELAGRDELTGLPNRRSFNQALANEGARQNRSSDSLSLLMVDVDFFKKYNDRYGHQAGDLCLQKVAQVFRACAARAVDLPARVGGEEFAILLPQTNESGAIQVANDILEAIGTLAMPHEDSPSGAVSVSIGIASWLPFQWTESSLLIQKADRALYESKRNGRNRLTVWSSMEFQEAEEQEQRVTG